MKYAVVYCSHTGNTKYIAEAVAHVLHKDEELIYVGAPDINMTKDADVVFVGFWTDKGTCPKEIVDYLSNLHHKQVALFGTCGFGGSEAYYQAILQRVAALIEDDCTYLDGFMCQGKMPMELRKRYELKISENPDKFQRMIENFDRARFHPNDEDIKQVIAFTQIMKHSVE